MIDPLRALKWFRVGASDAFQETVSIQKETLDGYAIDAYDEGYNFGRLLRLEIIAQLDYLKDMVRG